MRTSKELALICAGNDLADALAELEPHGSSCNCAECMEFDKTIWPLLVRWDKAAGNE